ncbi:hypothetical protein M975_3222 [Buttiauxella brennerae ATCC 51605]|jgi:hypothetical protein|uniref:Uncharacterized protein n=1 Tax=Buttiauxella brennerae ATCC 51605 TaxID=1354251 RepID=A0A1B7IJM9_9ENTR|nr:hypothetical protein M975_3222 [Buttiauxella brennerae ATCC 51605]
MHHLTARCMVMVQQNQISDSKAALTQQKKTQNVTFGD